MKTALLANALCVAASAVVAGQAGAPQAESPAVRPTNVVAIPGVVAAGAKWTLAWQGTDNADGLVGTADGGLLFAQEQPRRVSKLDPNDKVSVHVENTRGAGSVGIDSRGRTIAVQRTCTDPGSSAPCSEPTAIGVVYPDSERKILADTVEGKPFGRPNDLVVGNNGSVYFTSGGAFHLSPAGRVTSIGTNLRTNGIMLSSDEKTLYVTNVEMVVAFDVQPDGSVTNQRDFVKLQAGGAGDGMAIDAEGRLYVTSAPGVQVFTAAGKYLGLIPTPRAPASVAFSGRDKKTLYVTGAGALNPDGTEITTAPGVRNNAKTIFKLPMLSPGFAGRAK